MWYGFCRNLFGVNGFNWIGGVIMFLGLIAVGVIVYLILKNKDSKIFHSANEKASPQDILKQRLAKGEINEDTYNRLLKKISD